VFGIRDLAHVRYTDPTVTVLTSPEIPAKDAIAYHRELATGWEQRYSKPAFRARLRVFEECLGDRDLRGQAWLDAGCGSGTMARVLAERDARVLGVDAAQEMIENARKLASVREGNLQLSFERVATIAQLPLAAASLDGILCSSVLEYVPEPALCLAEFARVLRPGGVLVVSVANRNSVVRKVQIAAHSMGRILGQKWCAFLDYSRNDYTAAGFRELLKQQGFVTSAVIPFGSPIPHWLQRRGFGGSLLAFSSVRE
jgi:2-polyprenyl-6-hydroxyphenyl methylase/3-demethylubiquinone-9 3-methyltransferase